MKNILVINSSPRTARSHTRKLTETFVDSWKGNVPDATIVYRDLGLEHVPHVSENWIAGAFKPAEERLPEERKALLKSDEYIKELKDADIIVIGAPMYNYSITSSLKAYFDQVLRINETWKLNVDDLKNPYLGQLKNKKLFLLLSRSTQGFEEGGYNEKLNFQTTYLKAILKMMGIIDVEEVILDGELFGESNFQQSLINAHHQVTSIVTGLIG
ncbi:FMN-dependent NADH-azoreductase [Mucilaginibacter pineti]|uniref:FMN dependent NADH:quinone oxidoreductase n=1 Tax=Mucilaginibacter pineti TaxID=1391627 RepID=A0A1G6ZSY8_9SPHI|nr:NAD(P)H-dependent oxidoreductase [Mucilaginibacter pineti]SDE05798.1 FMN-dependent NADH-azoreductase [Mucilaginibacter pineti]